MRKSFLVSLHYDPYYFKKDITDIKPGYDIIPSLIYKKNIPEHMLERIPMFFHKRKKGDPQRGILFKLSYGRDLDTNNMMLNKG